MDESMRLKILGDASGAKSALSEVERTALAVANKVGSSFTDLGGLLKKTVGFAGIAVGLETALASASKLNNDQKAQSQLLYNQSKQQGSLIKLQQYQLQGAANEYQWKSKVLDQMATQLSLSNAISKSDIVSAQTRSLTNTDLLKFYNSGAKYLGSQNQTYKDIVSSAKEQHQTLSASQAAMSTMLTTAANIAEITHGNINSSMMMLGRIMADPAKRMSAMSRMGIQISKQDQARIKALEAQKGIMAAQGALMNVLDKTYHNIAATSASPLDILKNALQLIWTSLGQGLMPVLENLSKVVISVVEPLIPILQSMGSLIEVVASSLGASLGQILADMVPFIDLLVKGLIPALLDIITPLIQMASAIVTPLANAIGKLVGTGTKVGPLSKMFISLGETVGKALLPAVKALTQAFKDMMARGEFQEMIKGLLASFQILAPILPMLATAFAKLVIAITPAFINALPTMVEAFQIFAQIMAALAPLIVMVANALTTLIGFLTGNKGIADAIGVLLGVWFTRKLFLDPIAAAGEGIAKLGGKVGGLINIFKRVGTGIKGFGSGLGGTAQRGVKGLEEAAAKAKAQREAQIAGLTLKNTAKSLKKAEELSNFKSKAETLAEGATGRYALSQAKGGGLKGFVKSIFSTGIPLANLEPTGMGNASDQLTSTNENTQALMALTRALGGSTSPLGGLTGGFGSKGLSPSSGEAMGSSMGTALAREGGFASKIGGAFSKFGGAFNKFGSMNRMSGGALGVGVGAAVQLAVPLLAKVMPKPVASTLGGIASGASMGSMFGPWGTAIGAAAGGLIALYKNSKGFRDVVKETGEIFTEIGKFIWGVIVKALQMWWNILKTIFNVLKDGVMAYVHLIVSEFKILKTVVMDVAHFITSMWDGMVSGGKTAWNFVKSMFGWIGHAATMVWDGLYNAFVKVANLIITAYDDTIGWIPGMHINTLHTIGASATGSSPKRIPKLHSGGIVPGRIGTEVPAILQAGEAVSSIAQVRSGRMGGSGSLVVHPGAFTVNVSGSTDSATVAEIKKHVDDQFRQLRYAVKTLGR